MRTINTKPASAPVIHITAEGVSRQAIPDLIEGERIALSGHNGSGKTTLLRVLCGIYKPSAGAITTEGRIGALLDPTAGREEVQSGPSGPVVEKQAETTVAGGQGA